MNLEAEKVRAIEQVLAVQDATLMNELRPLIDEAVCEYNQQHGPPPPVYSHAELERRLDEADEDVKHGRVFTNAEAATHLRGYTSH